MASRQAMLPARHAARLSSASHCARARPVVRLTREGSEPRPRASGNSCICAPVSREQSGRCSSGWHRSSAINRTRPTSCSARPTQRGTPSHRRSTLVDSLPISRRASGRAPSRGCGPARAACSGSGAPVRSASLPRDRAGDRRSARASCSGRARRECLAWKPSSRDGRDRASIACDGSPAQCARVGTSMATSAMIAVDCRAPGRSSRAGESWCSTRVSRAR